MKILLKQAWLRFKTGVPAAERKLQLILGIAAASFGSMAAISWPGKLTGIGCLAGYIAAACGGMAFLLQFAMQTQAVIQTTQQVELTATSTTTTSLTGPTEKNG